MKKPVALLLALVLILSLGACGQETTVTTDPPVAVDGGLYPSFTASVSTEIQNLLPTNGNGNPKYGFYWNIYESLFDFDPDLNLAPDIAKGYDIVDDTHWQIHLFETVYDSAGNNIKASDVVFSINWLINAGEALNYDIFESVEAVSDYTVEFTWTQAPASASDIEFPLVRSYIFSEAAFDENVFATKPIGTGNYLVSEFVTGSKLVLSANPDYWALNTDEDVSMRLALHTAMVQEIT